MLLQAGENVLRSEYAVLLEGEGPGIITRSAGVLYLTNHRCVYETNPSRGMVRNLVRGRETVTIVDAPLSFVQNVTVVRPKLGRVRLHLEVPRARVTFDVLDPEAWFRAISDARRAAPTGHGSPVVATHTIERQVIKVRCRFCGSLGNEVDGRCPSCGAPL
ncbi:MAG: hypothetical protein L3K10_02955 [Thermoplasmata archaeon]|jgi:hypothetical protein|nr:hypothetical protein [Thermoplasmata archaeon]